MMKEAMLWMMAVEILLEAEMGWGYKQ